MRQDCILLVEDNDNDVILFRNVLEQAGILTSIIAVDTADAAIRYLSGEGVYHDRALHPFPRMVLVDLKLPGKSGHEVLRWLSKRPEFNQLVRVVLTGSEDPNDRRAAYESGANCYLQKPLTIQQLTGPSRSIRMLFSGRFDRLEFDPSEYESNKKVELPG